MIVLIFYRYKLRVINDLIVLQLLQNLRSEIQQNIFLRLKETEIYRIHQSKDVANLEGLDDSALKLFPSLLTLRNSFIHLLLEPISPLLPVLARCQKGKRT